MEIVRTPYAVVYKEESAFKDVYGGAGGTVFVNAWQSRQKTRPQTARLSSPIR